MRPSPPSPNLRPRATGAVNKAANPVAPFDQPFYLLLNLAVGGNFPGIIYDTRKAPYTMQVDWVRVYDLVADR